MAKPPVKPAGDSASDVDWQIASPREGALKMLLQTSSPAAVAKVATDLRLSSAMVYRLLAVYVAIHRPVPFYPIAAAESREQGCSAQMSRPSSKR
jgi:hypothetical protein